jgi:hypothetical protein
MRAQHYRRLLLFQAPSFYHISMSNGGMLREGQQPPCLRLKLGLRVAEARRHVQGPEHHSARPPVVTASVGVAAEAPLGGRERRRRYRQAAPTVSMYCSVVVHLTSVRTGASQV